MVTLNILVGLPGSGKSTFCNNLTPMQNTYTVVSSDTIRTTYNLDPTSPIDNNTCFNIMQQSTIALLLQGRSVVYDATNTSSKHRKALITQIKSKFPLPRSVYITATLFATPFNICLDRVANREPSSINYMSSEVLDKFYRGFQPPHYTEGFDSINILYAKNTKNSLNYNDYNLKDLPHDSKYHVESVGEHCDLVERLMFQRLLLCNKYDQETNRLLLECAHIHDIGKAHTKIFDENGVAHYYGHEHVGAYDSLFFESLSDDSFTYTIERAFLISVHMRLHRCNPSTLLKYEKCWGPFRMGLVRLLTECDDLGRIVSNEVNS